MKCLLNTCTAILALTVSTQALAQTTLTPIQEINSSECMAKYAAKIKTKVERRQKINKILKNVTEVCAITAVGGGLGVATGSLFIKGLGEALPSIFPAATGAMFLCTGLYWHFEDRKAHAPEKLMDAKQIGKLSAGSYLKLQHEIMDDEPNATAAMVQAAVVKGFTTSAFCPGNRVMRIGGIKRFVKREIRSQLN